MEVTLNEALKAASNCSGENAPKLHDLSKDNVINRRNAFLNNVSYNGARSHDDIITVLLYMKPFVDQLIN